MEVKERGVQDGQVLQQASWTPHFLDLLVCNDWEITTLNLVLLSVVTRGRAWQWGGGLLRWMEGRPLEARMSGGSGGLPSWMLSHGVKTLFYDNTESFKKLGRGVVVDKKGQMWYNLLHGFQSSIFLRWRRNNLSIFRWKKGRRRKTRRLCSRALFLQVHLCTATHYITASNVLCLGTQLDNPERQQDE